MRSYQDPRLGPQRVLAAAQERDSDQLGLFNEAEALASNATPAQEDTPDTKVAAHMRKKRGRKPLDPNLPREIYRRELPEAERFCANDGHALAEFGVEISEQLGVIPEHRAVIRILPGNVTTLSTGQRHARHPL